jgi:hypothetical protein
MSSSNELTTATIKEVEILSWFKFHNYMNLVKSLQLGVRFTYFIGNKTYISFLLDSKDTLSEENVSASNIDVIVGGVSGVDHQAVDELHRLGSLTAELAGNDNLATLSSGLHDKTENSVAGPAKEKIKLNISKYYYVKYFYSTI